MAIKHKVGLKAPNLAADVTQVQKLLNAALKGFPRLAGSYTPLTEDGDCGKLTLAAIKAFQIKVMGFTYPDQVVDPNGKTWKKLNGNIDTPQQLDATTKSWSLYNLLRWLDSQTPKGVKDNIQVAMNALAQMPQTQPAAKGPDVVAFRQGDSRWGKEALGNGVKTIHGYGCALTSLTMAATYLGSHGTHWPKGLKPKDLNPSKANDILKAGGAFGANSYMLWIVGGAKVLGMSGSDSGIGVKLQASGLTAIDTCLKNGGLVMAHVDYKKDWLGDHWILITQKLRDGKYQAIDPTYGKVTYLFSAPDAGTKAQKHVLLYGSNQSWPDKTPANVTKYAVVRYVTLNGSNP